MTGLAQLTLQRFLDRLLLRSVLNLEEQSAILALTTQEVSIRSRQDFARENQESSYCCLIASGLVARFGQQNDGSRQITAFHIPGEMADLHSAVRPIGIGGLQALSDVVTLRICHDSIRQLAARYPAIGEALWRDCMLDAAILMKWVVNLGGRDAMTRLANVFCEMTVRYNVDRSGAAKFDFPVTQEQLGEAVGLTGVHVNRVLRTLREKSIVWFVRGIVSFRDWGTLARAGEFDPAYLLADTKPERQRRLLMPI